MVFGRQKKEMGRREPYFWKFRHEIPLLKVPFIGPSGPPGGIRERSERALTLVIHFVHLAVTTVELASVASEL